MVTVETHSRSADTATVHSAAAAVGGTQAGSRPAVVYSIGTRIGGGGIGDVAAQAVQGLLEQGMLQRLLVLDGEISGVADRTARFPARLVRNRVANRFLSDPWRDSLFDRWAARRLKGCDAFYGWACHSSAAFSRRGGMAP